MVGTCGINGSCRLPAIPSAWIFVKRDDRRHPRELHVHDVGRNVDDGLGSCLVGNVMEIESQLLREYADCN